MVEIFATRGSQQEIGKPSIGRRNELTAAQSIAIKNPLCNE